MTVLEVVTPSYRPDLELCRDLNASVLRRFPDQVHHRVLVPRRDRAAFADLAGSRTTVQSVADLLPDGLLAVPGANVWINRRRPWPPARGWIVQQVVKLAAVAGSTADAVLVADSDIVFVRPATVEDFVPEATGAPLYRLEAGVRPEMTRHVRWHHVACDLLGLPRPDSGVLPDYICTPCVWVPEVVRAALRRVEEVAGRPWASVVAGQLHFSEMVLYGVFVDHVLGSSRPVVHTADDRCVTHWDEVPMDVGGITDLLAGSAPTDVALMVSAKSGTPLEVRRRAVSGWAGTPS